MMHAGRGNGRSPAPWAHCPALLIAGAAVLGALAQPPDEDRARRADRDAEAILAEARSGAEAGLKWLRLRAERAGDAAKEAAARADEAWRSALAEARAAGAAQSPSGVRLYQAANPDEAGADAAPPARWRPLADVASKGPLPEHIVVLVHGLDEPGSIWAELAPALHDAGFVAARFDYPDDQHIALSSSLLGEALKDLESRGVERVSLVCHSMGGLVVRDLLTSARWQSRRGAERPGVPAVERVFLIGTPNQGSAFARLQLVSEVREQFVRWVDSDGSDPAALLGFVSDGRGEAADDLRPGSEFLRTLNQRPLPADVKFTVIVAQLAEKDAVRIRELAGHPLARTLLGAEGVKEVEDAAEHAAARLGDGVVAQGSARLEGVDDTVVVSANHRSVLNRWGLERRLGEDTAERQKRDPAPAIPIIIDRLKADRGT